MRNRHAQIVACMPIGNGDLDVGMCLSEYVVFVLLCCPVDQIVDLISPDFLVCKIGTLDTGYEREQTDEVARSG